MKTATKTVPVPALGTSFVVGRHGSLRLRPDARPILKAVQSPGSRGGKGYHTKPGNWRYGQQPQHGNINAANAQLSDPEVQCPGCKKSVPKSKLGDHSPPVGHIADRCNGKVDPRYAARHPGSGGGKQLPCGHTSPPNKDGDCPHCTALEKIEHGKEAARDEEERVAQGAPSADDQRATRAQRQRHAVRRTLE